MNEKRTRDLKFYEKISRSNNGGEAVFSFRRIERMGRRRIIPGSRLSGSGTKVSL